MWWNYFHQKNVVKLVNRKIDDVTNLKGWKGILILYYYYFFYNYFYLHYIWIRENRKKGMKKKIKGLVSLSCGYS